MYVTLQKYHYWLPEHDRQVMRNFEIWGAKQLKNLFAYARMSGKMSGFICPHNIAHDSSFEEQPDEDDEDDTMNFGDDSHV